MEILGIDIGGSGIKGAIVNTETGELLTGRERIDTPQPATPDAVSETVKKLVDHFEWRGRIGVGFPAVVQNGVAQTASNIDKGWIGTHVGNSFTAYTKNPYIVVNDADAAGLAEVKFGAGKGKSGLLMVITVGTGIGSAIISNGQLVPNTELGHLRFKGGIAEKYTADSIRKSEGLSWEEWGTRFNEYLEHVYRLFYPNLIIIGGGASKKFDKFRNLINIPAEVIPAELQNQAGIVGAALAGLQD
ncbi:MAG: ROK family protein [Bacteroidia bacterium]|nr:ROK family protein [Bacteroidia bacterium]